MMTIRVFAGALIATSRSALPGFVVSGPGRMDSGSFIPALA